MRKLERRFISALKEGCLAELTAMVKSDASLCLELRGDYINVYYRGGNLMELRKNGQSANEYIASFDTNYFAAGEEIALPDRIVHSRMELAGWLDLWPVLKQAIDRWMSSTKANAEREFQQLALRDNNFGSIAKDTDYYVCDIEFQSAHGRFDMIAVHWPSEPAVRKQTRARRLVFVEVKYGDGALGNLHAHLDHVNAFASEPNQLKRFKEDMVHVFNQKWELGLVDCGKPLQSFSSKKPIFLLMLANHDPQKSALSGFLGSLPASPHVDVRIATASFLGYGLYEPCVHRVETVLECLREYALVPRHSTR